MKESFGLYLVLTNPVAGYDACAEAAVEHKIRYLQLRMKGAVVDEVIRVGRRVRAITRGSATRFIVNDDLEVARAVAADGLHLGQADMPLSEARQLWVEPRSSQSKVFGLSTHDESQAATAALQQPNYLGVGPVFPTPTKRVADPTVGVERAAAIIRRSPLTCVAIGGIDEARLPLVLAAGMSNFAVVRCVCQHPRPREPIAALMDLWRGALRG